MVTNNSVNLKDAGVSSFDGAGTFTGLPTPLAVSNGGTGASSLTAYAVLCGGTTSTNPIQSIASVGTSGQVLTSNGAAALPTFQDKNGYSIFFNPSSITPSSSSTYYLNEVIDQPTTARTITTRLYISKSGTISKVYARSQNTPGTSETSTFSIRLNDTTDTTISSSVAFDSATTTFSNTGLSIAVSAGDFIEIKWVTPTWVSAPTVLIALVVFVRT